MGGLNAFLEIERMAGKKDNEGMKRDFLTVYEAAKAHGLSQGYLRLLLKKGTIKGDQIPVTEGRIIWLISKSSLKSFLATERKPGRKPKKH